MALYHQTPYTVDPNRPIGDPAPLSQGMDQATADAVQAQAAPYYDDTLHLHVDVAGYDATAQLAQAQGQVSTLDWGDGSIETGLDAGGGDDGAGGTTALTDFTHTYMTDGVYVVAAYTTSDQATAEVVVGQPFQP